MRRAISVIIVLALIAGGIFAWLRGRLGTPLSDGAIGPGRSVTAQPSETRPALHLASNPPGVIAAGTPVFFTVTLEQPAGVSDESWLTSVRFESAEGAPVAWQVRLLGAPDVVDFSGQPSSPPDAQPQTTPPIARFIRVRYGMDPAATAQIPAGTYTIRVAAHVNGAPVRSDHVQFQMGPRGDSPLSSAEMLQVARFHLESREFDRAHAIALELVEAADDPEAYILLGDAFVGLKRDEEAVAAYMEALAGMKRTPGEEPPQRILLSIGRARERVGAPPR